MKILYAPWRSKYARTIFNKSETVTEQECVFCQKNSEHRDDEHFILRRFTHHMVILNLYPYNAGHLLIVPLRHIQSLSQMTKEERCQLIEITNASITALENATKAPGFNIGVNLGKAAGAGIPAHFHQHILPRWPGDTNFLPLLAQTKQISIDLVELYLRLKPYFLDINL